MRSTLLLAGFLAILPFISAAPNATTPGNPAPSPSIVLFVDLPNKDHYKYAGCREIPSLNSEVPLLEGSGSITVENCIAACNAHKYGKGGVGKHKCFCDNIDRGTPIDDEKCEQLDYVCWGTWGGPPEFCGSYTSLATYTM